MAPSMKRLALLGAKIAVSLALLTYLFSTTDLRALEERVRSADLLDLLAAVLCFATMLLRGDLALADPAAGARRQRAAARASPPRT